MGFLNKLNPVAAVENKIDMEIAEKTGLAIDAALDKFEKDLPAVYALLQGKRVRLNATVSVSLQLTTEDPA